MVFGPGIFAETAYNQDTQWPAMSNERDTAAGFETFFHKSSRDLRRESGEVGTRDVNGLSRSKGQPAGRSFQGNWSTWWDDVPVGVKIDRMDKQLMTLWIVERQAGEVLIDHFPQNSRRWLSGDLANPGERPARYSLSIVVTTCPVPVSVAALPPWLFRNSGRFPRRLRFACLSG